jgi:hypothetical protein
MSKLIDCVNKEFTGFTCPTHGNGVTFVGEDTNLTTSNEVCCDEFKKLVDEKFQAATKKCVEKELSNIFKSFGK